MLMDYVLAVVPLFVFSHSPHISHVISLSNKSLTESFDEELYGQAQFFLAYLKLANRIDAWLHE